MLGFHHFSSSEHAGHRFGFNGKEKDDEVSGNGNQYDYGFRIYNPRIGRFLSVDPLTTSFPWYTPYQFAGNKPIYAIDLDGLEEEPYWMHLLKVWLGIAEPPQTAEDAKHRANERTAISKTFDDVEKIAEANNTVYGSIVPGYSSMYHASKKQYLLAGGLLVVDVFGGELFGSMFKGGGKFIMNTLFKGPVDVPRLFENVGVKSFNFVFGENPSNKTAVIGQGMGRVQKVGDALVDPEVFVASPDAVKQWDKIRSGLKPGEILSDEAVEGTLMYKENVIWINDVKAAGYNIIDLGEDASGIQSTFYNMEKKAVYGN